MQTDISGAGAGAVPAPSSEDGAFTNLQRDRHDWEPGIVMLLENWTDNAKCYEWMHETAQSRFSIVNTVVMTVTGILTTAAGLSNTVVSAMADRSGFSASWIFGIMSVAQSFFMVAINEIGFKRRAEQHGNYANQWRALKFQLESELKRPVASRADCSSFVNIVRKRMEQISGESDNLIPISIRTACAKKFSTIADFDVPEICGDMEHTQAYVAKYVAPVEETVVLINNEPVVTETHVT